MEVPIPWKFGRVNIPLFLAAVTSAVYNYYYADVDPNLHVINLPTSALQQEYDFIVVGAGSAGNVLANRLTEVPDFSVLLLEAGGDETAVTDTPFLAFFSLKTDQDWNYTTVPQEAACRAYNGRCPWPRGRLVGGCSSTNIMFYVRGNPYDFNNWAALGNPGWSYDEVLPYFLKSEGNTIDELQGSPYHNSDGPLTISYARFLSPLRDVFVSGGVDMGYKRTDYNSPNQTGFSRAQYTVRGPSRCSTGKAFLSPARNRTNLNVALRSHVTRVIFEENRAVGVEFTRDGEVVTIRARREVILSAGAINTPQLLLLSGVGPADHLESLGIPVVANLSVGDNLQDHLALGSNFQVDKNVTFTARMVASNESINAYAMNGSGPLTSPNGWEVIAFLSKDGNASAEVPDLEFEIGSYVPTLDDVYAFSIWTYVLRPNARGTLRLRSTNPNDRPLLDPRYFSDSEDYDTMVAGIRAAFNLTRTPSLAPYSPKLYLPFYPACVDVAETGNETALIECLLLQYTFTNFHPAGTCKMGPASDSTAVVGSDLLVHNMTGLRVVDASIMPVITSGNINAPTIMIAEKASDMIKEMYGAANSTTT